jgi:hypothetical protein
MNTVRNYAAPMVDFRDAEQIALGHRLRNRARRALRALEPNPVLARPIGTQRNLPRRYATST